MADMQVSSSAPVKAAAEVDNKPQKAENVVSKHLNKLKNAMFGTTGSAILAGAASGALIAGLPGAAVGAVVGLGLSAGVKAATDGKKVLGALNTGLAGALAGAAFGLPGLLVGGAAYAFATGAAQKAASKVADFLSNQAGKAEPAPAQ